jgi:glutamate racemase
MGDFLISLYSMNNKPIGIFDSGVGGLSILLEIQKILPNESFIFVADQSFVPYGEKTKEQLVDRVGKIMQFFETKDVKAVVAACNTATVYTIDEMRERFPFPLIGTVPVVKTLANISKTRKAAVFSTPATAKSPYLAGLIEKFAPDMEIIKVGGSNLEQLVETGGLESEEVSKVLHELLPPLVEQGVDAIALGCTHYPFLREQIQQVVGPSVTLVDSGGAVSRRLQYVLEHNNVLASEKTIEEYYTTGDKEKFEQVARKLTNNPALVAGHIDL